MNAANEPAKPRRTMFRLLPGGQNR